MSMHKSYDIVEKLNNYYVSLKNCCQRSQINAQNNRLIDYKLYLKLYNKDISLLFRIEYATACPSASFKDQCSI